MQQGYFFIGDLLGFGKIIENTNSEELTKRINQWLQLVKNGAQKCGIKNLQLISDTVFAATDSSVEGINKILNFAQYLLSNGVPESLPIRGAITHGEYNWDEHFTYGKAVIDAHKLEMAQNWVGVACSPALPHLSNDQWPDTLVCYPVPKKNGPAMLQAAIVWEIPDLEKLSGFLAAKGLTKNGDVMDWAYADKIIHTINFRNYIHLKKLNGEPNQNFRGLLPNHVIDYYISSLIK